MRPQGGPAISRFRAREGDRCYYPFAFLAVTGCRRGEALGLRWSELDRERKTAALSQTVIPLTKPNGVGREGRVVHRTRTDGAPRSKSQGPGSPPVQHLLNISRDIFRRAELVESLTMSIGST